MPKILEQLYGSFSKQLLKRYAECDSLGGHLKPDRKNNFCDHCYRHLIYKPTQTNKRLINPRKIIHPKLPLPKKEIAMIMKKEITLHREMDFINGLERLTQEFNLSNSFQSQ